MAIKSEDNLWDLDPVNIFIEDNKMQEAQSFGHPVALAHG